MLIIIQQFPGDGYFPGNPDQRKILGERWIRRGLVITQYVISVIFIVAFLIINQQIRFTQTKNLGYSKDNVLVFERQGRINWTNHETFMTALRNIPGVIDASGINGSILDPEMAMHSGFSWEGQAPEGRLSQNTSPRISRGFVETTGLKLRRAVHFQNSLQTQRKNRKLL